MKRLGKNTAPNPSTVIHPLYQVGNDKNVVRRTCITIPSAITFNRLLYLVEDSSALLPYMY